MVQVEEEKREGGPEMDKKVRCVAIFFHAYNPKWKVSHHLLTFMSFIVFFSMEHTDQTMCWLLLSMQLQRMSTGSFKPQKGYKSIIKVAKKSSISLIFQAF